jgi:hypothetical protein
MTHISVPRKSSKSLYPIPQFNFFLDCLSNVVDQIREKKQKQKAQFLREYELFQLTKRGEGGYLIKSFGIHVGKKQRLGQVSW